MTTTPGPYDLAGTENRDRHPCWQDPSLWPGFRRHYQEFNADVTRWVAEGRSRTVYKFGAGDHLFLTRRSEGSAEVGFRALSRPYDQIGHERFMTGAGACDLYACELYPEHQARFAEVLPGRAVDLPAEFLYAAVASRWVFHQFAGSIGLIGADRKLALIQRLLRRPDYRHHLGLDRFEDYVGVPQRFACDDLDAVEHSVAKQLEHSTSRLFLVGVGHVKSGLLHRLPRYAQALFLDVGQGIDAIAGLIDTEKPYFGSWTNYTVDEPSWYTDLDVLSYVPYSFLHPEPMTHPCQEHVGGKGTRVV